MTKINHFGKKLFGVLLVLFCFQFCFYSENYFQISETDLQTLEQLNQHQETQIKELRIQFQNLNQIMNEQKKYYNELEKTQLKNKFKIGGMWFSIGLGVGALTTTIIILSNK